MLKLLIDHDFNHHILRGLLRRIPNLDAVTAYQARLDHSADPELISHAAEAGRVIVSHDVNTMPGHAALLMREGRTVSGIIIAPQALPILGVIDDLEIIVTCSGQDEWENVVRYLPL